MRSNFDHSMLSTRTSMSVFLSIHSAGEKLRFLRTLSNCFCNSSGKSTGEDEDGTLHRAQRFRTFNFGGLVLAVWVSLFVLSTSLCFHCDGQTKRKKGAGAGNNLDGHELLILILSGKLLLGAPVVSCPSLLLHSLMP